MNTEKTKNGLSIKQNVIGLTAIVVLAFCAYIWISQPDVQAKDNYQAQSPAAQLILENFEHETAVKRCELIKNLASLKLEDDMNGVKLENIDRNDLAKKRDQDCSF